MTTMTLGQIATMVEIGIMGSISSSTKDHPGDMDGIMATDAGVPPTTMATTVGTTHGVAIGTTLGTMVALDTTGATDVLGMASMLAGVGVAIMVVTMVATTVVTMEAMPIATGMATAMADMMVVGIGTTAPHALAMAEVQVGTMIEPPTMPSTDVPLATQAAQ